VSVTTLPGGLRRLACAAAFGLAAASTAAAAADSVQIYSAGSARAVVEALVKRAAPDIEIKATFGGSGLLRERIEGGEHPDLFLSADLGSPRKLAAAGRTVVPVVAFARNRMCLAAQGSAGVTAADLVDRMLADDLRLRASTPVADPAGDYALAIFDRIDAARPGAGRILREKAQRMHEAAKALPPLTGVGGVAALFRDRQIDLMITYCSAAPALEKEVPGLTVLPFPPELEPGPVYGLAVLSARPAALRVALLLMSEDGQAIVKQAGLLPILEPR
jgi:ABC-type molybdate transport system substrate-binding protein